MIFHYHYCGLDLESDLPLVELNRIAASDNAIVFHLMEERQQLKFKWTHHWKMPDGQILLSHCRMEGYHWLQFPDLADFQISEDITKIDCYPAPGIPEETIQHMLLDQVLPRCLAQKGMLMLHASAIQLDNGVVLFIGSSGAGKSTLAGNFHLAGQTALSDDCVRLVENRPVPTILPSYKGLRLWEDSIKFIFQNDRGTRGMAHYSSKKRVGIDDQPEASKNKNSVLAIIVVSPSGEKNQEIFMEMLTKRESFIEIFKQTFHLDVNDFDTVKGHLKSLGRMMPGLRVWRLHIPRNYKLLSKAREIILEVINP